MAIDTPTAVPANSRWIAAPTRQQVVADRRHGSAARRVGRLVARVLYAVIVVALAGVVVGEAAGYRLLAIRSGSMTPALEVGDLVISRSVPPTEVAVGDVVTFRHAEFRHLVTHRALSVRRQGGRVDFVTMGDANRVSERWSIPVSGRVGKEIAAFPHLGRVATSTTPMLAFAGIALAAVAASVFVLRRIWSNPSGHADSS